MFHRETRSFDPKWALIGLAGAVVVAAGLYASTVFDEPAATPQVVTHDNSTVLVTGLDQGPVPGMPEGTYRDLTAVELAIPTLDNGPVPGLPEGTYQHLRSLGLAG